ncbi:hypothetical protein LVJ82_09850 [Vitreoscilla massiliensis]|uniref:Copper resistance protein D domain-containing protein n=1 Tax=Vitreoscilla massiliensis TaxID=1689272 RepID=A0ABY4DWX0_9NEIS|nr:hypothetical protein [Vitreoscilla massiliensis]UOO87797.1 hypothetical protein LVJ82_09850 [Vitreoscilla massiliensis]
METALNTVLWLVSVAAMWVYCYRVVLRQPFVTVAKHFGMVLILHLLLGVLATGLSLLDWSNLVRPQTPPLWLQAAFTLFIKGYITLLVVFTLNFAAAFATQMVNKIVAFHQTHNAANLHRQPLRALIQYQHRIIVVYQALFMLGGVGMLWAVWFKTSL